MRIEVDKNFVKFNTNNLVNKREFKATPLEFSFSKDYEGLTCKAVFSVIPKTKDEEVTFYQQPIIDNKCYIPYEVMDAEGILIGVYGYSVDGEELLLRYSPEPKNLWFLEGSYYEGAEDPEEILPSQFEQYVAYLNSQISRLDQMKIETEDLSNGVKISITNSNGITTETTIYDGEKGEQGERGPEGPEGPAGRDGTNGTDGRDGYVQYTAGTGIDITNNVISASGGDIPMYVWNGKSSSQDVTTIPIIQAVFNHLANNEPFEIVYNIENQYGYIFNTRYIFTGGNGLSTYIDNTDLMFYNLGYYNSLNGISLILGYLRIYYTYANGVFTYTSHNAFNMQAQTSLLTYTQVLTKTNTTAYTPSGNYNPATKKYVDDNVNPTITSDNSTTDYIIASLIGNQSYKLGELTSLTITSTTTFDRESVIYFTSGSTATSVSLPDSITNIGDVPTMTTSSNVNTGTCEANKSYIIAILNNIAVWKAY